MPASVIRKTTLLVLACVFAAGALAQATPKLPRVGVLAGGTREASERMTDNFREGLRARGWIEGRTIVVDYRFADGDAERLPALARELVDAGTDVIVAAPSSAVLAVRRVAGNVPLVMANVADPVGLGLVASVARPGGTVTGLAYAFDHDVWSKQLQYLKEAVPAARRLGVVYNPAQTSSAGVREHVWRAASALGLSVHTAQARAPADFEAAFAEMARARVDAVLVLSDPMFGSNAARMAEISTRYRLPTMHGARSNVLAGGLLFYGPDLPGQLREAAEYVDLILKGASPGSLPVRQPNAFELVVNAKTARAIGLKLTPPLLQAASEVIE